MEMTTEQKQEIVAAMQKYVAENDGYSQNKLAKDTRVNVGYLDAMVKGTETGIFCFNNVQIKDVYFDRVAAFVGLAFRKEYWRTFETEQYLLIESAFVEVKSSLTVKTIVGGTGTGKTYGAERMKELYPNGTFIIKCANDFNLRDFVRHIADIVGVRDFEDMSQSRARLAIEKRLKALYDAGVKPVLVFDEAENLKLPAWGRLKALYDGLKGLCGFVVNVTPNFYKAMKRKRDGERDIAPQVFRRFMSGLKTIFLPEVSASDIKEICAGVGVKDRYVINRVCASTYNYGDLNDTLTGLQRAAEAAGCAIDRQLYELEYKEAV